MQMKATTTCICKTGAIQYVQTKVSFGSQISSFPQTRPFLRYRLFVRTDRPAMYGANRPSTAANDVEPFLINIGVTHNCVAAATAMRRRCLVAASSRRCAVFRQLTVHLTNTWLRWLPSAVHTTDCCCPPAADWQRALIIVLSDKRLANPFYRLLDVVSGVHLWAYHSAAHARWVLAAGHWELCGK